MYAAIILLLRFNREIVHYISSFLSVRCALCDDGRGILVKNGYGRWDVWCLKCGLSFIDSGWSCSSRTWSEVANTSNTSCQSEVNAQVGRPDVPSRRMQSSLESEDESM